MQRIGKAKLSLSIAFSVMVLSILLAVISLYPLTTGDNELHSLVNSTFTLSPNEIYRQGLGSFRGTESISVLVQSPTTFARNFSIATYNGLIFNESSSNDIAYSFTAGADYYDAVFTSVASDTGAIHFQASVTQQKTNLPYSYLNQPAKILFIVSSVATIVIILIIIFISSVNSKQRKFVLPSVSKKTKRYLMPLLIISLIIWLVLLAFNSNFLATFENWYTDNGRHSYTSNMFLKDGFSVFSTPLGALSNFDNSSFKFVTWPEMPHLYPLGSIFLFFPFGISIESGISADLIFKLEIALFLVLAHICLYFFCVRYFAKDFGNETKIRNASRREQAMTWIKAAGFYIVYVSLVIYAADGMFDAVSFLFSLFALFMFMEERYDVFFLLVAASVFFKYQAGIFLLPLILVGIIMLFRRNNIFELLKNKMVLGGLILVIASLYTAWLSAPFLFSIGPQFIMNGINAFSINTQIPWVMQATWIILTLTITLAYAMYMLNKNSLLSLSAVFLLLPSFMLPYFQNWYLPYFFVYVLIPQQKKEMEVTLIWLIFMVLVLSFGGTAFNPLQILTVINTMFHL